MGHVEQWVFFSVLISAWMLSMAWPRSDEDLAPEMASIALHLSTQWDSENNMVLGYVVAPSSHERVPDTQ